MDELDKPEIATQNRVVGLFRDTLGYRYLGNRMYRDDNSNIESAILEDSLRSRGYSDDEISHALEALRRTASVAGRHLYDVNKEVYQLLRYGATVQTNAGERAKTVHFVDWEDQGKNDFAIAEEVTLRGNKTRRPDIVLYVNGIAVAVLELKKSSVLAENGIRQNISNQREEFNQWFYATVQFLFAGNDSQGLFYGPIGAQDKHFLRWREDGAKDDDDYKLDQHLRQMCKKKRLLDLIYNFVLFDGGTKKLPRPHQYFGVVAAQKRAQQRTGGIIWHTQGSGKSLVMTLLSRWILGNIPSARILVITDRRELDQQIRGMFGSAGDNLESVDSCADLRAKLGQPLPRAMAALIHKFGGYKLFEEEIKELQNNPPQPAGDLFVLVDECHRTESGRLHEMMKAMLPNAVFIGFTGTPLLKEDKHASHRVFGSYIHKYRYDEAVKDKVVLDLVYEARQVEQSLSAPENVDEWFEAKTSGLNKWQKNALKKKWANMRSVRSARTRIEKIAKDVNFDFVVKPRLKNDTGTAMLAAGSIYEAYKYYDAFSRTGLRGKCAVITSYNPNMSSLSLEDTGANSETDKVFINTTHQNMLHDLGFDDIEKCETTVKKWFTEEPVRMKLLIVVDKLLTGFDAPSCTYLYIDKQMRDHGLFQAICRVNRLDGDSKRHGFIVDYKGLFDNVTEAISVYTSELDHDSGGDDPQIHIRQYLKEGKKQLENARERMMAVIENVPPPKGDKEYIRYFCGNSENANDLETAQPKREKLYKSAATLVRALANIAGDMSAAGYTQEEIKGIKKEVEEASAAREIVRKAAGEYLDTKSYEADMRMLIDHYIDAKDRQTVFKMEDSTLVELIGKHGAEDIARQFLGGTEDKEATSEAIANNIRKAIKIKQASNPAFYDKISKRLDEILRLLREKQIEHADFLREIEALVKEMDEGDSQQRPHGINTKGKQALYDYFIANGKKQDSAEALALKIDDKMKNEAEADWVGNTPRTNRIRGILSKIVDDDKVEGLLQIIKQHTEYKNQ